MSLVWSSGYIGVPGKMVLGQDFVRQSFMYANPDTFGLWSPSQITTELWADAADSSTITFTSGLISQWNDKSGNGRHMTQATALYRPGYSLSNFNEFNSIDYPVGTKFFDINSFGSGTYSWFFSFKSSGGTETFLGENTMPYGTLVPIGNTDASTNILRVNDIDDPAGSYQIYGGELVQSVTTRTSVNVKLNLSGGNICGYINIPIITPKNIRLGYAESGYNLQGSLGEVICINGTPNSADILKIQGYLAHKWGLTSTLPSDHLYKLVPPFS